MLKICRVKKKGHETMTLDRLWEEFRLRHPEKMSLGALLGHISAVAAKLGEPESATDDGTVSWFCEHGEVMCQVTPHGVYVSGHCPPDTTYWAVGYCALHHVPVFGEEWEMTKPQASALEWARHTQRRLSTH